jgi:hypothetical protein
MNNNTIQTNSEKYPACNRMVKQIIKEKEAYRTATIDMSSKVTFCQYDKINDIRTHQNGGFLNPLANGQKDDRKSYDIITPMIETSVVNLDIDTESFDTYATKREFDLPAFILKSPLQTYLKQTGQGETVNDIVETFCDDGNVIVVKDDREGKLFSKVHPLNLWFTDISAENLEQTGVGETKIMTYSQVINQKDWQNTNRLLKDGNISPIKEIPYYEIDYRYHEVEKYELNEIKKELGENVTLDENDKGVFVQALVIKGKLVQKDNETKGQNEYDTANQGIEARGIILFAEETQPETIKVNEKLTIKRYKPYEYVGWGKFNGRLWREGLREKGIPYQNTANELGTRIARIIRMMRAVFWTDDSKLFGMNVLSSIKDGQVISVSQGHTFNVVNNNFPVFSSLIEEWNRNIEQCRATLKSYEVATGENSPTSASATAISVQNQAVGRYFKFKRQKLELFFGAIFNRWVIPQLIKQLEAEENKEIEISGSHSYMDRYTDMAAAAKIDEGVEGNFSDVKKELLNQPKHYFKPEQGFFKDADIYLGLNAGGEAFNKQAKISNGINLMQFYANPAVYQNPAALDLLNQITLSLGYQVNQSNLQPQQGIQPVNGANVPQKETSAIQQTLNNNL